MSGLFGAMDTAISGLSAQSAAFSNISDNIANSQTTGYKRIDTSFLDYLTPDSGTGNLSGSVVAQPEYENTVQGTISATDNPLALAISGQGFFSVSQALGSSSTDTTFSPQQYYTRAGDFQLNSNGYLVNSDGDYLNGWPVTNGQVDTNTLTPIQFDESIYAPVATGNIDLSANLPPAGETDSSGNQEAITTDVSVYDSEGNAHQLTVSFLSSGADSNNWTMTVTDDQGNTIGSAAVTFNADGTLASITDNSTGNTNSTSGSEGTVALTTDYPTASGSDQTMTLNLGTIGGTSGLTQFAGSSFSLSGISQDGVPPGNFSSITMQTNGDVVVNYSNGQTRTIAQVPVATFAAPDALEPQNGSSFTATVDSGPALAQAPGNNGAGTLVTSSIEESNVDIATEFTQLIVAQQAYSAGAKTVTTANDMMQATLNIIQ